MKKDGGKRATTKTRASCARGSCPPATADVRRLEAADPPACHPGHREGHTVAGHAR
ncbi:hypothetical protein BaRGS_00003331, partial [Batillaria attramentaria]